MNPTIPTRNWRLTGWFQVLTEDTLLDAPEDAMEEAIREALKPLGITFQGGPCVHEVKFG